MNASIQPDPQSNSDIRLLVDILETTSDLISTSTPDAVITYLNSAGRKMLGLDPDTDISTLQIRDLHPEWAYQIIKEKGIQEATQTGSWQGNTAIRTASGTEIPVSQVILAHFDDNHNLHHLSTIMRDISNELKIKEELQLHQEYLRVIFNDSRIPLVIMDATTGNILDCNNAAVAEYGYADKKELQGLSMLDLSAPLQENRPAADALQDYISDCLHTGASRFEWHYCRRNREIRIADIYFMQFFYQNKPLIQYSIRDITEQKKQDAERQELHALLETALAQSQSGIIIADAPDVTIRWANAAALNIRGGDSSGLTGIGAGKHAVAWQTYLPDGSLCSAEQLPLSRAVLHGETVRNEELIIKDNTGQTHWVTANSAPIKNNRGEITAGIVIFHDITANRIIQDKLRESEERYRNFIKNSSEGIFCLEYRPPIRIDQEDSAIVSQINERTYITEVNDALAAMYLVTKEEMVGRKVIEFSPDTGIQTLQMLNSPGYRISDLEVADRKADGTPLWIVESFYGVVEEGCLVRAWGVQRDITARKNAEAEKEKLRAQLMQAQKMESVGRLAGGVAHDFNNMLSVILGHAEMALEQTPEEQPLYTNLQEILKAAHRSANLTRQLLAFARKQTVHPQILDLNTAVQGMLSMLRRLIGEDVELHWAPGEELWPLFIDPTQVDQLVVNQCVNARDAVQQLARKQRRDIPGKITIETANITIDKAYADTRHGFLPGDYVLLVVSDNGIGMDKETQTHLFEPFFTTKNIGEGTGLGLATVYGIVKQNNGFINVYSEPGQGTVFRIYLPRCRERMEPAVTADQTRCQKTARGTILLVEDEPAILSIASGMLSGAGYQVLSAESPAAALELARSCSGEISLLLTDVIMPKMDGQELSKQIRKLFPGIKTVYMSGYTANVIAARGILEKDVDFLQKPFTIAELTAKIRSVLEK